jgi:thymidine kinase
MERTQLSIKKTFRQNFMKFIDQDKDLGIKIFDTCIKIAQGYKGPGLNKEKIRDYWSYRVNENLRIITFCENNIEFLATVDNHDDAYRYCNQTKPIIVNSKTIQTQNIIKPPENSNEILNNDYIFLLNYGFPKSFVNSLRTCSENEIKESIRLFAPEFQDLILSKGKKNTTINEYSSDSLLINDDNELKKALLLSLPEWCLFLHPIQATIKDFSFNQNLIVKGGPGTGKTIALVWRYIKIYNQSSNRKPLFICRSKTTAETIKNLILSIDKNIKPEIDIFPDKNILSQLNNFNHILIDEAQDLNDFALDYLWRVYNSINKTLPPLTIAIDFNQSILNLNSRKILRKFENVNKTITLDYCYRSTEEIIKKAKSFLINKNPSLVKYNDSQTSELKFPLTGNEVSTFELESDDSLIYKVEEIIKNNNLASKQFGWCIIFSGYFNNLIYDEINTLYPNLVLDAEKCKGKEYFNGIVIHYSNNIKYPKSDFEIKKCLYEPYVAISRFRDSVTLIDVKKTNIIHQNTSYAIPFNKAELLENKFVCRSCHRLVEGDPSKLKTVFKDGGYKNIYICNSCEKGYNKYKRRINRKGN